MTPGDVLFGLAVLAVATGVLSALSDRRDRRRRAHVSALMLLDLAEVDAELRGTPGGVS